MATDKKNSINEHLNRILFKSNYQINEAKYSLVDNIEEDDTIPDDIWKDPKPISKVDSNVHEDEEDDTEEQPAGEPMDEPVMDNPEEPVDEPVAMDEPSPEIPEPEEPAPSINDVQNDILKTSVSAMQKMNDQLNNLEQTLNSLNLKIDGLNKEVEQVKEPTNEEKLQARKDDSHPFYMNLNDMWNGNSFQARRQVEDSYGIKKLDDGTYVADFDTLPKYSAQEIKDSF